ncbi:MAG: hypothetical protein JNM00_14990, partial [Flavobacteriales bacterium]|nr:hypothetical protein [Flavobacteriales bacterium]
DVLNMIQHGISGWEEKVPTYVDTIIKENRLFGFDPAIVSTPEEEARWHNDQKKVNPF